MPYIKTIEAVAMVPSIDRKIKMKSAAAQAAKLIKQELKKAGIKASVKSENYAGGNSVTADIGCSNPEVRALAEKICKKYQYGHFNSMEDIYEFSNNRDDLPQAKYVFVDCRMSDERRADIYNYIRTNYEGGKDLPQVYSSNVQFHGIYLDQFVWRLYTGQKPEYWAETNASKKVEVAA